MTSFRSVSLAHVARIKRIRRNLISREISYRLFGTAVARSVRIDNGPLPPVNPPGVVSSANSRLCAEKASIEDENVCGNKLPYSEWFVKACDDHDSTHTLLFIVKGLRAMNKHGASHLVSQRVLYHTRKTLGMSLVEEGCNTLGDESVLVSHNKHSHDNGLNPPLVAQVFLQLSRLNISLRDHADIYTRISELLIPKVGVLSHEDAVGICIGTDFLSRSLLVTSKTRLKELSGHLLFRLYSIVTNRCLNVYRFGVPESVFRAFTGIVDQSSLLTSTPSPEVTVKDADSNINVKIQIESEKELNIEQIMRVLSSLAPCSKVLSTELLDTIRRNKIHFRLLNVILRTLRYDTKRILSECRLGSACWGLSRIEALPSDWIEVILYKLFSKGSLGLLNTYDRRGHVESSSKNDTGNGEINDHHSYSHIPELVHLIGALANAGAFKVSGVRGNNLCFALDYTIESVSRIIELQTASTESSVNQEISNQKRVSTQPRGPSECITTSHLLPFEPSSQGCQGDIQISHNGVRHAVSMLLWSLGECELITLSALKNMQISHILALYIQHGFSPLIHPHSRNGAVGLAKLAGSVHTEVGVHLACNVFANFYRSWKSLNYSSDHQKTRSVNDVSNSTGKGPSDDGTRVKLTETRDYPPIDFLSYNIRHISTLVWCLGKCRLHSRYFLSEILPGWLSHHNQTMDWDIEPADAFVGLEESITSLSWGICQLGIENRRVVFGLHRLVEKFITSQGKRIKLLENSRGLLPGHPRVNEKESPISTDKSRNKSQGSHHNWCTRNALTVAWSFAVLGCTDKNLLSSLLDYVDLSVPNKLDISMMNTILVALGKPVICGPDSPLSHYGNAYQRSQFERHVKSSALHNDIVKVLGELVSKEKKFVHEYIVPGTHIIVDIALVKEKIYIEVDGKHEGHVSSLFDEQSWSNSHDAPESTTPDGVNNNSIGSDLGNDDTKTAPILRYTNAMSSWKDYQLSKRNWSCMRISSKEWDDCGLGLRSKEFANRMKLLLARKLVEAGIDIVSPNLI